MPQPSSAATVPGEGVRAVVEGVEVAVGRREWVLAQVGSAAGAAGSAAGNGAGAAAAEALADAGSPAWEGSSNGGGPGSGSESGGGVGGSRWESSWDEDGAERSEVGWGAPCPQVHFAEGR